MKREAMPEYVDFGVWFWVHREANGFLLAITTDRTSLHIGPGDKVLRQRWLPVCDEIESDHV